MEIYSYIFEVKESTEKIIKSLSYGELTRKILGERKERLKSLHVVSSDEIEYEMRKANHWAAIGIAIENYCR